MEQTKHYFKYWGKASREDDSYHLLPYHCLDVAAVGYVILDQHKYLHHFLAQITELDKDNIQYLLPFLLTLHDIGKFSANFQNLRPALFDSLQSREWSTADSPRHDSLGFMLWQNHIKNHFRYLGLLPKHSAESLLIRNRPVGIEYWMQAMLGHHGVPPKKGGVCNDYFETRDVDAVVEFVTDAAQLFLPPESLMPEPGFEQSQLASWWLAGFAVLCDWLGSNTDYFKHECKVRTLSDYWSLAIHRAEKAVAATELLPSKVAPLMDVKTLFSPNIDTTTPLQAHCESLEVHNGSQLFLLEDVTGAGKTEAAVMLAHRLMAAGYGQGIYFGLPTMATANAMYDRMAAVYQRLFKGSIKPSLVLAHGARDLSAHFRQSLVPTQTKQSIDYGDDTEPAGSRCSAWFADNRKKALLAEVGVGTIDQALMAILPSRHQSLRLLGLLGKVLLVDEVHACDTYMNRLLCKLLHAHAASGGSAVLLSATLPTKQRQQLVDAFSKGAGWGVRKLQKTGMDDYPLFTHAHAERNDETELETRDSVRRSVKVKLVHVASEVEKLIAEAVAQGQCVCWIRNTVTDARDTYFQLCEKYPDKIDLFHARYAMQDRLNIETSVVNRFGSDSTTDERRGRVLIATQVVEQSLDLDFDLMVTDLAPIDLIIQRAGRLHRHLRGDRGVPTLIINGPDPDTEVNDSWFKDYFNKAGYVYPHHGQLWLTAHLLKNEGGFRMPEDARFLIEGVYASTDYPAALDGVSEDAEGRAKASGSLGGLNALEFENGYSGEENSRWWDEAKTPTRLAEVETTTVYLARWDGLHLVPWIDVTDHPWPRSAVQVRSDLAAQEAPTDIVSTEMIEACRERLPAKGRWGVVLPLIEAEDGFWFGLLCGSSGSAVKFWYHQKMGLSEEVQGQLPLYSPTHVGNE
ncbi:MAG: CRISPR-associated helicase Cas3' [Candidatus Thiodiazotropha sp. 4PDIVS1]